VVAIHVFANKKQKRKINYRIYYTLGIIWLPLGIIWTVTFFIMGERFFPLGSVFLILGIGYLIIGLVVENKWKKEESVSPTVRKKMMIMVGAGVVALTVFALLGLLI